MIILSACNSCKRLASIHNTALSFYFRGLLSIYSNLYFYFIDVTTLGHLPTPGCFF